MPNSGYFDVAFGSAGPLATVPDGVQSDGSVSYTEGYGVNYTLNPATNPSALNVENTKMNQIFNDITTAIQLQQQGLPAPFITSAMNNGTPFSYAQYATVIYGGVAYQSNVGSNTDTPPSTKWNIVSLSSANTFTAGTSTGSANAQVLASLNPATGFSTAVNGQSITFTAGYTNTGSTTLAITSPSVSATVIKKVSGGSLVNLSGGEITATAPVYVTWNLSSSCWVLNSGPALGTMAPLNIGNNMANDGSGNAVATIPPLAISGTNETYATSQWGALIARSNSGTAMADTVPNTLPAGWYSTIQNTDASAADVISPGAGASFYFGNQTPATIIILPGETWQIESQGSGVYEWSRPNAATLHSGAPQSAYKNLQAAWASTTTFTVTADAIIVQDANGNTRRITNVNQTINSATSGAGGLDTGSIANNTWYYGYTIFNPATNTVKGLMSASATSPTLPSGYTFASGPITAVQTDGSAHFHGFMQTGTRYQFTVGNNLAALPALFSGGEGTWNSAWASITVRGATSLVPTTAAAINGFLFSTSSTVNDSALAPNTGYGNGSATTNPPPFVLQSNGVDSPSNVPFDMLLEGNTVAVQSQTNSAGYILGFTLNI